MPAPDSSPRPVVEVDRLVKSFGPVRALDSVSFQVNEGEILGFLGPNGAGKSTCMRIVTGFLPGDSGSARVAGFDVHRNSVDVRRNVGYLPEGVPLYPEMRVNEYLRFRSRLKAVPRRRRKADIDHALDRTGVTEVRRRIIGTLSRGYRQRVGLADALLGNPRVLILDEPTVGLDPEQQRQFRALLRELSGDRTVILSTHILSEVEASCTSVVIIHEGRVVARDRAEELRQRLGASQRIVAEIAGPRAAVERALAGIPGVEEVSVQKREKSGGQRDESAAPDTASSAYRTYCLEVDTDVREQVFATVAKGEWRLRELRRETLSMEDVFVGIVGEQPS